MRATHPSQQRPSWLYLYVCIAGMAVALYAISESLYSFSIYSPSNDGAVDFVEIRPPRCPQPSSKLPPGERYMFYSPHSGFSNQVGELKNALLTSALLNRTLILPPVFDHHAVSLGSCPKFRVHEPHEMRAMAWKHISELIHDGRYVAIADIVDLSSVLSLYKTIDLRIFSSLWCGANVSAACLGSICRRAVASGQNSEKLESCGSLLSKLEISHGDCVYPVADDCRTTIWVYDSETVNKSQQSRTLQSKIEKKGKKTYQKIFRDIVDTLGDGSEAAKFQILSFGSLFSSEYKGTQLHFDIQSNENPKVKVLVEKLKYLPFTPTIMNAGKSYAMNRIRRPFFCAQLRLLDGQFKNHWSKTFLSMESQLKNAREQHASSEPLPLFVMTDLPRSNWTNTYLGDIDSQTSVYEVHVLEEGDAFIQEAALDLVRQDYGLRSGFLPPDEHTEAESLNHSFERTAVPDILLYVEEVICSCAALGFVGTSGSTLSENISMLRLSKACET